MSAAERAGAPKRALRCEGVRFAYPGAAEPLLRDLTFSLRPGELVALLGANGSGKSTLCLLLAGLLPPQAGAVTLDGRQAQPGLGGWDPDDVQLVQQSLDDQVVAPTVWEDATFGPACLGLPAPEAGRRAARALARAGLPGYGERAVETLSGGELARAAAAGALAVAPRYLLLDEPTAHLDPDSAARLVSLLRDLAAAGLGVLLVTHRPEEARRADRAAVLHQGRVAVCGPPHAVLGDADLLARCGLRPPVPPLPRPGAGLRPGAAPLLRLRDVSQRVGEGRAGRPVLHGVSLSVAPGELVAVAGPSGAGKTTLLEVAAALQRPAAGTVELLGTDPQAAGRPSPHGRGGVAMAFQAPERMFFAPTVAEEIGFGLARPSGGGRVPPEVRRERVRAALRLVGLPEAYLTRHPAALSGGEQRLVAVASVLVTEPALAVLDEPTAGLAPPLAARLLALLRRLCDEGRGVLLATHDVHAVAPVADRLVVLVGGRVVAEGPPGPILARWEALTASGASGVVPDAGPAAAAPREPPVGVAAGMLGALLLGLGFFLPAPLAARAAVAAGLAGLAAAWGLSLRRLARLLRPVLLLALLAGLLHVLTAEGGRTLLAAGPVSVTTAGLAAAAGTVLRVCGPVLAGLVAAGEGSPVRAARGLSRLLGALPLGRRVAADAAVVVMLVARFASLLRTEVARVERAQRARGGDRTSGTVWQRAYGLVGVLVPVLTGSLERAERLALTLHLRGLRGRGAGAGPAGPLFRRADGPWLLASGALLALLLALAR